MHTYLATQYQARQTQEEIRTHASQAHEQGHQSQQSLWRSSSHSSHAS